MNTPKTESEDEIEKRVADINARVNAQSMLMEALMDALNDAAPEIMSKVRKDIKLKSGSVHKWAGEDTDAVLREFWQILPLAE